MTAIFDVDLEASVLSAVLVAPDLTMKVLAVEEGLPAEAFYREFHRRAYEAMLALATRGEAIDPFSVAYEIQPGGDREELAAAVDALAAASPNVANVRDHARRLIELARWRQVELAGQELVAAAAARDSVMLDEAEGRLAVGAASGSRGLTADGVRELLWAYLDSDEDVAEGAPIAFARLREPVGSLRFGETTIVAGWTSHGKSVVIDALLAYAAEAGYRAHLYINEMTEKQRSLRLLSSLSGVPLRRLASPSRLSDVERAKAAAALGKVPFGITGAYGWSASDLARDIRFRGWEVAAIDLLHLIAYRDEAELSENMGRLTTVARATGTHLLLGGHLNEERAKTAKLPVPVLRDIRGSGMIKNDTDNVLFIHRSMTEAKDGSVVASADATLYVAKCKNGSLGSARLILDGPIVSYREATVEDIAAAPSQEGMPF